MDPLFTLVITIFFIAFTLRIANEIERSKWMHRVLQGRRLRRRGRSIFSAQSIRFTIGIWRMKLLCRLGLHDREVTVNEKLIVQLPCRRWFCNQ